MNSTHFSELQSLANKNYEDLLKEAKSQLIKKIQQTCDASFSELLETDPMTKFLEVAVYREFLVWQQVDEAIKASLLGTALGENLGYLASLVLDEDRKSLIEKAQKTPDAVRNMVLNTWKEPFHTTGTEAAYTYYAKQADSRIVDVKAIGELGSSTVNVIVLGKDENASIGAILPKVEQFLLQDDIHRIGDKIVSKRASLLYYRIQAKLKVNSGVSHSQLEAVIRNKVREYANRQYRIGATISLSKLYGAFYQDGVKQVLELKINEQAKDLTTKDQQAPCWDDEEIVFSYEEENPATSRMDMYVRSVRHADSRIRDVLLTNDPNSGKMVLWILPSDENVSLSSIIRNIEAFVESQNMDANDTAQIKPAPIVRYTIEATLLNDPEREREQVESEITKKIRSYANQQRSFGATISLSKLYSLFYQGGAKEVVHLTINHRDRNLEPQSMEVPIWKEPILFQYVTG
jgi:phage-related baseplate assembly protein